MKRNQIIILALAAFIGLWMYSQSGKASTVICDTNYSKQIISKGAILVNS